MAFDDGIADFRSDTVTRPTPEMFEAMRSAPLGDDVYHDDPTVLALEEESAEITGKESAIYVPTGTMGNELAIMLHTNPGDEVLAHESSHVRSFEGGAPQALAGVGFRPVAGDGGRISSEDVDAAMELATAPGTSPTPAAFRPRIGLMLWENTHNMTGGRIVPIDLMESTSATARGHGLAIHVDGARIFNAVAATGVAADRWAAVADTIQFCFSKGLGAPVGSILCGASDLIDEARYLRKRLGGGMRQAGVIAAAARVGLADRDRLADDNELAQKMAGSINERFAGSVDVDTVETNMINVDFGVLGMEWSEVSDRLASSGLRCNPPTAGSWRIVTHRDVDANDADRFVTALS